LNFHSKRKHSSMSLVIIWNPNWDVKIKQKKPLEIY
jgi:hypothetical protein